MTYVDGFVMAVPKAKKEAYRELAAKMGPVFKKYGALQVTECWGDDVPDGKVTSFPMAVKCQDDEAVVFSWIVWPSKQVRDEGTKKMMDDPVFQGEFDVYDGKRMIFGGFEPIFEA